VNRLPILQALQRYHDVQVSPSGVWRILHRLGMGRLPASQRYRRHVDRWKRYEKPLPGHWVQIDVKVSYVHRSWKDPWWKGTRGPA
jgi:hypothetical protein